MGGAVRRLFVAAKVIAGCLIATIVATDSRTEPGGVYTILQHGQQCVQEIGPVPTFNCLDGEVISITRGDVLVPAAQQAPKQLCDRPPLLGLGLASTQGQCVPYSRIGTLPGRNAQGTADPNIQWAFICRRYRVRTDPNDARFEDVALIGHNKATGATCFFQALKYQATGPDLAQDSTRVPPPDEPAAATPAGRPKAAEFWLTPQQTASINCFRCHDSGAFIHTPHIDQVRRVVGGASVPIVPADPNLKATPAEPSRYRFVGTPFQAWPAPVRMRPLGNICTSCHNIGVYETCSRFAKNSTGLEKPTDISSHGWTWPRSHWMPPDSETAGMTQAEWTQLYRPSLDKIVQCCGDVADASCRRKPFDP
jgi:hypothetical protein